MTNADRQVGRVVLLTNPAAGHGNAPHAAELATARFQERGVDVVQIVGRDATHALQLTRDALDDDVDALVVAGGDGVISLAWQVLAGTTIPLGIVPAGTGNDHAREYGVPTGAPEAAVDVVIDGVVETIDLGHFTGDDGTERWFGTVLATGFDSIVSDRVNHMRWPHGRMRYNIAILAEFGRLRPLPFRLEFDDGTTMERAVTLIAFGNTRSYGGGMRITPGADHHDGLLDVTVLAATSRRKLIRFFPRVFSGTHVDLDEVSTYRTASVRVECDGINAYADGEYLGPLPGVVSAIPDAGHIIRPRTPTPAGATRGQ